MKYFLTKLFIAIILTIFSYILFMGLSYITGWQIDWRIIWILSSIMNGYREISLTK